MATITVDGVDRSAGYTEDELGQISLRYAAMDGEVGQGSVPIPDPAGTQTPYAGESFEVEADAETVFDGFVGALLRERGVSAAGTRLVNLFTVGDENAVLHGFAAYKWSRPAETTRARFLAMLADFVPWVTDTTWVTTAVVEPMSAKVYTTESLFDELMTEIRDLTGNVAFVEHHRAHLHPATNGITGDIAFSDAAYDYADTFPVLSASPPKRSKDPMELRTSVRVVTPGGSSVQSDAVAVARHDAGGLKHDALVVLAEGTLGDAARKARVILASSKAERITYEFDSGPFTAEQIVSIPVGCLIAITSAVLGLTASTQRIAAMTVTYMHPDKFMVHFELGYPVRRRGSATRVAMPAVAAPAGGGTGDLAIEPGTFFDSFNRGSDGDPAGTSDSGHTWASGSLNGGRLQLVSITPNSGAGAECDTLDVAAFEDGTFRLEVDFSFRPWDSEDYPGHGTSMTNFAIAPDEDFALLVELLIGGADNLALVIVNEGWQLHSSLGAVSDGFFPAPLTAGVTYTAVWTVLQATGECRLDLGGFTATHVGAITAGAPRTLYVNKHGSEGSILYVDRLEQFNLGASLPSSSGQLVENEATGTGDGSTSLFTTAAPYRPGSLRVKVNGVDVTASVFSQNPYTGDFSLSFVPRPGSEITTSYMAN